MKNYFFCDFMVMKLFFVWFFYSENQICPVLSLLKRHILSLSSLETVKQRGFLTDSDKLLFSLRGHLGE